MNPSTTERTCSNCSFFNTNANAENDEPACLNIASIAFPEELIDADFCCHDHESSEIGAARDAAHAAIRKAKGLAQ